MQEVNLADQNCSIWICSARTEQECLNKKLFGDSEKAAYRKQGIQQGYVCFLFNVDSDELLGTFIAISNPSHNIDPSAWNGYFPFQIRVEIKGGIQRIRNASSRLSAIGIEMTRLKSGKPVPVYSTFAAEFTKRILGLLSKPPETSSQQKTTLQPPLNVERRGFSRVAGLKDVKEYIQRRVITPQRAPQLASIYRLRRGGGLLLYGPPGTGKTIIARAIAEELSCPIHEVSPSIVQGYPGEAEQRLAALFQKALAEVRSVFFFDEADALLRRDPSGSTVMQRVIPTLKNLLSDALGKKDNSLVVIAATNAPWDIDESFLRPGRFDFRKHVDLPNDEERDELFRLKMEGVPIEESLKSGEGIRHVAQKCDGFSGADIEELVRLISNDCFQDVLDKNPNLAELDPEEEPAPELLSVVTEEQLIQAIGTRIKPSVRKDVLIKYEQFSKSWK